MLGEREALTGRFDASTLLIATPLILEVTAYVSGSGSSRDRTQPNGTEVPHGTKSFIWLKKA